MSRLPILLSIPHGGTQKPPELEGRLCISNKDLFDDSDPFVIEIYDLDKKVQRVISTNIARAFVDLNRSPQDLPPTNPDGLIKSSTCYQKPIYHQGQEPGDSLRELLINLYYFPYHRRIQQSFNEFDLQLCLDCHSMASVAPDISPDGNNKKRPMFCLSNQDGKTSSNEMIEQLAKSIQHSFSLEKDDVQLNKPFKGGYITKTYGNKPIPWIQVEMNRDLYLSKEWFDHDNLEIDKKRLTKLNQMFEEALIQFYNNCLNEQKTK